MVGNSPAENRTEGKPPQGTLKLEKNEMNGEIETEIEVGELIDTVEYDYETFHLSMDCFWCNIKQGKPILKEHEAAKWLTKGQLYDVDWLPADVTLIDKIKKNI